MAKLIVHALWQGRALCGFCCNRTPDNWPDGHLWTVAVDVEHINCAECLEVAKGTDKEYWEGLLK